MQEAANPYGDGPRRTNAASQRAELSSTAEIAKGGSTVFAASLLNVACIGTTILLSTALGVEAFDPDTCHYRGYLISVLLHWD